MLPSPKTKAIFVDGASAAKMQEAILGRHGRFNLLELYNVLAKEIGVLAPAFAPVVTIPEFLRMQVKNFRSAGFQPVRTTVVKAQDDRLIIDRIKDLDLAHVGEIGIMTSDQDFVRVLRQKVAQGIKVYWVSTRCVPTGEKSSIGASLDELFEAREFEFVELAKFRIKITSQRTMIPNLKITLNVSDRESEDPVMTDLLKLVSRYPALSYQIEPV